VHSLSGRMGLKPQAAGASERLSLWHAARGLRRTCLARAVTMGKLQTWEGELLEVETQLLSMGHAIEVI
jgi:hypothetical protein